MRNKQKRCRLSVVGRESLILVILLVFTPCLLPSAFSQQSKPAAALDAPRGPLTYDSFKLVHTRNVFDPDRRPVRAANAAPTTATRADYVAFTGTMINGDKSYAFFSGSRADFNKVLTVGEKIASSTVTQITPFTVVVERDGRKVTVNQGQTVPLDGKSAPGAAPISTVEVTATTIDRPPTGTEANPPSSAAATNPAISRTAPGAPGGKPPAGNKEELMRKMMEKRQQELK